MIDYHLHLWPHSESSVWFRLDQIAAYCEEAADATASPSSRSTEHAHRFVDVASVVGPFWLRFGHEPTSATMAEYWDFHARNSLEEYVTLAQAAKDEGLPVKIGLEVDYYKDQMDDVSRALRPVPLRRPHRLGALARHLAPRRLRQSDVEHARVDRARRRPVLEELHHRHRRALRGSTPSTCSPTPISSRSPGSSRDGPGEYWDAMAESAARVDVSHRVLLGRLEEARWRAVPGRGVPRSTRRARASPSRRRRTPTATSASPSGRATSPTMLEARGVSEVASYTGRQRQMIPLRAS